MIQPKARRRLRALIARGFAPHLLLLAASVLLPLALFALVAWQDWRVTENDAAIEVARGADSVREHALKVFQTDTLVIALIQQRIQSMSWDEIAASRSLHDYLFSLVEQNPELEGAWIADASGAVRNSSRFFPAQSANVGSRDFFVQTRASDGLALSEREDDLSGQSLRPQFHLAQRRKTNNGTFDGIIALSIFAEYFPEVWRQSWHNPPHVLTGLMNSNLQILARMPAGPLTLNPRANFPQIVRAHPEGGMLRIVSTVDGIDRLIAYRRIAPYGAYVVYGISVESMLHSWYQHLLVYGSIFGFAAIALAILSLLAARHMQREQAAVARMRRAMRDAAVQSEQRRIAEKQLVEVEKMQALGQMAGGFAHDFGNVLMAIRLNLDYLSGGALSESQEQALRSANEEAERGSQAVRSLMIFARHGSLDAQQVDAKTQLEKMTGLLRQVIGAHSTLELAIDAAIWPVEVNLNQLELALLNLAINARDAMPDGGTLRVVARNVTLSGKPDGLTGDFVEIAIADTGQGMPQQIVEKALQPFFTTKEAGKGTGLGLSQVCGFAKRSGGTVTLKSVVGNGTTVTIYLPKCAAVAHQAAAPATI